MHRLAISLFLFLQGAIAPAGGVVTGRLLNTDGSPAAKVRVSVMPVQDVLALSNLAETDAAGNFRITDVAPGKYYVVAGLLEFPTFYPGTRDLSAALVISVTSRATVPSIEFRVAPASGGLTVSGRVVGGRLPMQVSLGGRNYISATVKADGTFEIPRVLPGRYTLSVSSPLANSRSTMVPVEVVDKDVRDVEVRVQSMKTITGRIQLDGRGAIPRLVARIDGRDTALIVEPPVANAREGTFRIAVPEGETRIDIPLAFPEGYTVKSFTYGDTDLKRNPLKVTAADTAELRVVLGTPDRPPVKVSGRVVGVEKSAVRYRVTLESDQYPRELMVRPAADGSFEFPEVFPGEYRLGIPELEFINSPGRLLTIGASDVRDIDLRLPAKKEILGRLSVEGGGPLPRLSVTWSSAPGPRDEPTRIEPQADGTFRIALYEGSHTDTTFELPRGYSLTSMTYGPTDLTRMPFRVSNGDNAELRIVLTAANLRPVKVSGKAVGGETVSLKSAAYAAALNAKVAADGTFEFPSVLPGNYALMSGPKTCAPVVVGDADVKNVGVAASGDVSILSAIYGVNEGAADVTPMVRKWMKPGGGDLYAAPRWLELDPVAGTTKALVISYLYQCEEHRWTGFEPWPVNYNMLVWHADPGLRPVALGNTDIQVVEAYYGNGNVFRTVTPRVRELLAAGKPFVVDDATLNATVNNNSKQLIVTYTYKGIPSTFIANAGRSVANAELAGNAEIEMLRIYGSEAPPWLKDAEPFAPREPGDTGPGFGNAVRRELAIAYLLKAIAQLNTQGPGVTAQLEAAIRDMQTDMNYRYPAAGGAPIVGGIRAVERSAAIENATKSLRTALSQLASANPNQDQRYLDLARGRIRDAVAGLEGMK